MLLPDNFTLIILISTIILFLSCFFLYLKLRNIEKKQREFFKGNKASDLEGVLFEQIRRMRGMDKDIKRIWEIQSKIQGMASRSIQKVGVVRFNPFKDIGGDQSFAIALLDSSDSGLVVSSLYTREGTRIYTKPIEKGVSRYNLSEEEKKAISQAMEISQ